MKNRTRLKRRVDKMVKFHIIPFIYKGEDKTFVVSRYYTCNPRSVFYIDPRIIFAKMTYVSLIDSLTEE